MAHDPSIHKQFLFLYAIALADFDMHPKEVAFLTEFGRERGISESEIEHFLLNPTRFDAALPETVGERIESLYHLARMVWADDVVKEEEREMLRRFCKTFEFKSENTEAIVDFLLEKAKSDTAVQDVVNEVTKQS